MYAICYIDFPNLDPLAITVYYGFGSLKTKSKKSEIGNRNGAKMEMSKNGTLIRNGIISML